MPEKPGFQAIFQELKAILKKYEPKLVIESNDEKMYCLRSDVLADNGKPQWFGATRLGKGYVSYYLVPIYMYPELLDGVSDDLKSRMQGKSCFNFKTVDSARMKELTKLTRQSFDRFKKEGWL